MRSLHFRTFYVYILTNKNKTVLYTGVTNDLSRRLCEHRLHALNPASNSFTGRYNVFYLIYYEEFSRVTDAIAREKEIKGWRREKKVLLINKKNPEWVFLNGAFGDPSLRSG